MESLSFSPEVAMLRLFTRSKDKLMSNEEICNELTLEPEISIIYKSIQSYYKEFKEHNYISKEELYSYICIKNKGYKDLDVIRSLIESIYNIDISDSFCSEVLKNLQEKHFSNTIVQKLLPVISGNSYNVLATIEDELLQFQKALNASSLDKSPFEESSLQSLLTVYASPDGIQWKLKCLQEALGCLTGGALIHIVARPEVGKSSFLADNVVYFAKQLADDECILWLNNEEASGKLKIRMYNALLGITQDQLIEDTQYAQDQYEAHIGNKVKLISDANVVMSIEQTINLCKKHKPKVLIIDHADKLFFNGSRSMDVPVKLRELYKHYREIGKLFNVPILAVGHANTEAEGKKWLTFDHLDYSRTGKAAEVDVILGIGQTHKEDEQGYRYLSLPKNKLKGVHGKYTVRFEPSISRYYDME